MTLGGDLGVDEEETLLCSIKSSMLLNRLPHLPQECSSIFTLSSSLSSVFVTLKCTHVYVYEIIVDISCFPPWWKTAVNHDKHQTSYLPPAWSPPDALREANADHRTAELGLAQVEQLRVSGELSAEMKKGHPVDWISTWSTGGKNGKDIMVIFPCNLLEQINLLCLIWKLWMSPFNCHMVVWSARIGYTGTGQNVEDCR